MRDFKHLLKIVLPQFAADTCCDYLLLALCLLILPACSMGQGILPYIASVAVDVLSSSTPFAAMPWIILMCTTNIVISIIGQGCGVLMTLHLKKCEIRSELHGVLKLMNQSVYYLQQRKAGELLKQVEHGAAGLSQIGSGLMLGILPTMLQFATAIVILSGTGAGYISLIIMCGALFYMILTAKGTAVTRKLQRVMMHTLSDFNGHEVQNIVQFETIKAFAMEDSQFAFLQTKLLAVSKAFTRLFYCSLFFSVAKTFIQQLSMGSSLVAAAAQVAAGSQSPGSFVMIQLYVTQLFLPIAMLSGQVQQMAVAAVNLDKWLEIVSAVPEICDGVDAVDLINHCEEVETSSGARLVFDDVSFRYGSSGTATLSNVAFSIPSGSASALVGSSGSGKSSCFRLILRFFDVASGSVQVGGIDVRRSTQNSLRRVVGLIPQDTILFNDTLRKNLVIASLDATDDSIHDILEKVCLTAFVDKNGLEISVGERGAILSGGERQRVGIARALMRKVRVLLLDEATSALDNSTEKAVMRSIQDFQSGVTKMTIAHRLTTIAGANCIYVFDHGRVVQSGSHAELLAATAGKYIEMWKASSSQ